MNKTFWFSLLSVFIPLAAYLVFSPAGFAPAVHPDIRTYLPFFALNGLGLAFSVIALSRSNPKPTDTSFTMRISVLLANIGMLANVILPQLAFAAVLFKAHS